MIDHPEIEPGQIWERWRRSERGDVLQVRIEKVGTGYARVSGPWLMGRRTWDISIRELRRRYRLVEGGEA